MHKVLLNFTQLREFSYKSAEQEPDQTVMLFNAILNSPSLHTLYNLDLEYSVNFERDSEILLFIDLVNSAVNLTECRVQGQDYWSCTKRVIDFKVIQLATDE